MSLTECSSAEGIHATLLIKSKVTAERLSEYVNNQRMARNAPCFAMIGGNGGMDALDNCVLEQTKTIKALATSKELSKLVGTNLVPDMVVVDEEGIKLMNESKGYLLEAKNLKSKMKDGRCPGA